MKTNIKTNIIGLLPIMLVVALTIYLTVTVLRFPLVGIEVKEQNNQWMVEDIYNEGWANGKPIEEGNIIKLVNEDTPEKHSTVALFNRIEKAKSITVEDKDFNVITYMVSYEKLDLQYITYLFFPLIYTFITFFMSIFLYRKKKDDPSVTILIYFLLSVGVCYLSASTSARGDTLGRILNFITLPGSILLCIHFLKSYFRRYNLIFIPIKHLMMLYAIYAFFIFAMLALFTTLGFNSALTNVQLVFLIGLIGFLFFYLIRFYYKNKNSKANDVLKILWFTLFSAIIPFLCFYAIPLIFFNRELISAEITAIFSINIPIGFVYLQLANKLFDIDFLLSRLRFYSLLSIPFTIVMAFILKLIFGIKLLSGSALLFCLLLFTCTILFLYIKEYVYYKMSEHLFSQKNNFEASLYKFFQKAKDETKVASLINNLINEIRDVLMVKEVIYLELMANDEDDTWIVKSKNNQRFSFMADLENLHWDQYKIGSLIELKEGFIIIFGGDYQKKHIIFLGLKKFQTSLNIQERIWLETLAYISSILLENFQLIEELFHKIESYKEEKEKEYPSWLSRLLFTISEKERANLSIDLHDSVLQDLLQLLREIDNITEKVKEESLKNDLYGLKERILDNIHLVRETCNELRPPFLNELGLIESIHHLFDQTNLRANFILNTELDSTLQTIEKEYELTLYRVVQELLNNAMKHSEATHVNLSLTQQNQILTIDYQDNGVGMEIAQLKDSFETIGLSGIKERIKSIGGTVKIHSNSGNGMRILIEIVTGSDRND
jgi:two-component system, NarL family, sensor histidine kinase ComP